MIMRKQLNYPYGPIISWIRLFDILSSVQIYYQYSSNDTFYKGKAMSVPCDTGKHQDISFRMNKFSKKEPTNFL